MGGAYFLDEPDGIGKTFLYHALLAYVRFRGMVTIAVAMSGVAASLLPGGRMAHSRFKLPIDIDEKLDCKISKQGSFVRLIRCAELII